MADRDMIAVRIDHREVTGVHDRFDDFASPFEQLLVPLQLALGMEVGLVHSLYLFDRSVEEVRRRPVRLQNLPRLRVGQKDGVGCGIDQRPILLGHGFEFPLLPLPFRDVTNRRGKQRLVVIPMLAKRKGEGKLLSVSSHADSF